MPVLNISYAKDQNRCAGPVYFPGELYTFYINFDKPISDPDFEYFRLDLRKDGSDDAIAEDIGKLLKDSVNANFYNIRASYLFPDVRFGWYRLAIIDTVTEVTKALSNPILCEERDQVKNTAYVVYRHKKDLYNFRYEANPNFWNKIRLPMVQTGFRIESERKQYRNVTNRRLRNYKNYKDEVIRIESYYTDEDGHRAFASLYDHDTIFIDSTFIVPKDAYVSFIRQRSLA